MTFIGWQKCKEGIVKNKSIHSKYPQEQKQSW